jgi:hypothetical protein
MNVTTYNRDGIIVEQTIDNLDGTGTRTDYRTTPPTITQLTGLPINPPAEPTAEERLTALLVSLAEAQTLEEIRDAAAAAGAP